MPVPGGTTRKLSNAPAPQRKNSYRSLLRENSNATFLAAASLPPAWSTMTEWSITRSTGDSGLIFSGLPPIVCMASRIAAKSTTAGTPVKSWRRIRDGRKAISFFWPLSTQFANASISALVTEPPSSLRSRFSSRTFNE